MHITTIVITIIEYFGFVFDYSYLHSCIFYSLLYVQYMYSWSISLLFNVFGHLHPQIERLMKLLNTIQNHFIILSIYYTIKEKVI